MSGKKKNRNGNGSKSKKEDIPLEVEEIVQKGEEEKEEMNEETKEEKGNVNVEVNTKAEAGKETKENIKTKISGNGIVAIIIVIALLVSGLIAFGLWSWGPKKEVAAAETTITTEAAVEAINSEKLGEIIAEAVQSGVEKAVEETKKVTETTAAAETTTETTPETTAVTETTAEEKTIEAEEKVTEVAEATGEFSMGWNKIWPWSPFRETTKQLPDELTHEIFAEPGTFPGMNGDQTAWDKMENETTFIQAIEGGGTYISTGGMKLELGGKNDQKIPIINLPFEKSTNYLVFVRGLPADGTDKDLNRTIFASEYVPGHSINHVIPMGAYFSLDWTLDQVQKSFESPNCGEGCHRCVVVVIDLQTRTMRIWEINDPDGDWKRIDL